MHCVLVGNYGVGNTGDEALREYFLSAFPDMQWTIVSGKRKVDPPSPAGYGGAGSGKWKTVPRLPLGFRSLFAPWLETVGAIRKADALVFGGGSLFTDTESVWACIVWGAYAATARFFRTPYILAFQGIGPFRTVLGRVISRRVCRGAAFMSVRDEDSLERVREFDVHTKPVLTFDPAFAYFATFSRTEDETERILTIIPRTNADERFFDEVMDAARENFDAVQILLLEPNAEEKRVGERLRSLLQKSVVVEVRSVAELPKEVSRAAQVVTQRYHGALAAIALEVPCTIIPQAKGDKLSALRDRLLRGGDVREECLVLVDKGQKALAEFLRSHV